MARKETIRLDNIKQDLRQVASSKFACMSEWRFVDIPPLTLIAILMGVASYLLFEHVWMGLPVFLMAAYHIVQYIIACKRYIDEKRAIREVSKREDVCVSTERLSRVSIETIHEPHLRGRRSHALKVVDFLNFHSCKRWRLWGGSFYAWSKEYYMSADGIGNISIPEDEFFYVSLQHHPDIACVYPRKYFVLEERLKDDSLSSDIHDG